MTHLVPRIDEPVEKLLPDALISLDEGDLFCRPSACSRSRSRAFLCLQFSPHLNKGQSGCIVGEEISGTNVLPMVY